MLPYKTLIHIDRDITIPLYIQICNSFINLIKEEILKPYDVLPSTRKLARLISINRNTANLAYEELISQGWAESVNRKGIFVNKNLPTVPKLQSGKLGEINNCKPGFLWTNKFQDNLPAPNLQKYTLAIDNGFPDVRLAPIDTMMAEYRSISKRFYGKNFLKYGNPKGCKNLRISIGRYLSTTRGLSSGIENILITKGSQMGIYLAAQLLLSAGDTVAVGTSNYHAADATFKLSNANLLRIPVDENGMDIDYLEHILKRNIVKAVYIIPHHHCPTTVVMSMERRQKLLRLAKEYSFAIIEDDYNFEFNYEDSVYLPLASMDNNHNVIYIGSFSKTLAPAIRTGYLIANENFINAAASLRNLMDRQGDSLLEEALASLFNNGEIERHFRKTVKVYRERRNIFCDILTNEFDSSIEFQKPKGGLAVWSAFEKSINMKKVSELASKKGLYISNGDFYKNESFSTNGIRMGFASLETNEMEQAFDILKKSITR